jgi:predicted RecA/RadA family phage recombinase
MAKNFIAEGETLVVTAPYARLSGEGTLVGSIFGVATHDALINTDLVIALEDIWELAKTDSQAWTVGARIYWDDTTKLCTTTASTNKLIGVAVEAVAGTAGLILGKVLLTKAFTI